MSQSDHIRVSIVSLIPDWFDPSLDSDWFDPFLSFAFISLIFSSMIGSIDLMSVLFFMLASGSESGSGSAEEFGSGSVERDFSKSVSWTKMWNNMEKIIPIPLII